MDLATLQARFQKAIVDGDDEVLSEILDSPKEDRTVLLGVYRNAYSARLIDFLKNDYPKLRALLGDEQFDELATGYIGAYPSQTPNARWFGERFPDYLSKQTGIDHHLFLSELAALDQALNDVFDATDVPPLRLEDLAAVAPEDWVDLSFAPNTAVRRLDLNSNAAEVWQALHNESEMPEIRTLSPAIPIIVSRGDGMASYRPMTADEAMMWDEAARGVKFSVLCEMLAMHGGEDDAATRAAGYLQNWIVAGLLSGFDIRQ